MAVHYNETPDTTFYASDEWRDISTEIMERDGFRCRLCGSTENLTVHHIVPRMYKHLVNFDIDGEMNLVTLCWEHHHMADRKVDKWGMLIE